MTEGALPTSNPRFPGRYDTAVVTQSGGLVTHRQVFVLGSPDSASYLSGDLMLDIASGKVTGVTGVNKFGENTDLDTGVTEDIWTGGGTWAAPTTARTHQIVSTDAADASGGAGAKTIRVYGLTGWGAAEVSEDISMNGITNVPTANTYVIIHRMNVLTKGSSGPNVGVITATADTDATVTARISATAGQTLMAIYGIPSVQTLYATSVYGSVLRAAAANVDMRLNVNPEPDAELTGFLGKQLFAVASTGGAFAQRLFRPYIKIPGPAIIKLSGTSSANNVSASGGFDGLLVTN